MYAPSGDMVFSANQVAPLRILLSSLFLLPFGIIALRRNAIRQDLVYFLLVALCGNMFPAFLFTYAETGISSGFAGMLNSTTPIFTILIGFAFFSALLSWRQIVGSVIGCIGVVLLLYFGQDLSLNGSWQHVFAVIVATLCYAINLCVIRYKLSQYRSIDIAAIAFILLLIPSAVLFALEETWTVFSSHPKASDSFIAISILGVVGTAFALLLFNYIIKNTTALFASSVTYFIPIVAVAIGFAYGELISLEQISSMLIVLLGVFIANYNYREK